MNHISAVMAYVMLRGRKKTLGMSVYFKDYAVTVLYKFYYRTKSTNQLHVL